LASLSSFWRSLSSVDAQCRGCACVPSMRPCSQALPVPDASSWCGRCRWCSAQSERGFVRHGAQRPACLAHLKNGCPLRLASECRPLPRKLGPLGPHGNRNAPLMPPGCNALDRPGALSRDYSDHGKALGRSAVARA
jgi:hypothetical protein